MELTPEQVEELERLEALATKGPWHTGEPDSVWYLDSAVIVHGPDDVEILDANSKSGSLSRPQEERRANAALTATMRNALPALLADNKRLAARVAELEVENRQLLSEKRHWKRTCRDLDEQVQGLTAEDTNNATER